MYFSDIVYETNILLQILQHNLNPALLKHSGLPRNCCFQTKNTGSKLNENAGISQITELSTVNWAIIM